MTVEMETRQCGCGKSFRVMKGSGQMTHASQCDGTPALGGQRRPSSGTGPGGGTPSGLSTARTGSSEKRNLQTKKLDMKPIALSIWGYEENNTDSTRRGTMQEERSGQQSTESGSDGQAAGTTPRTGLSTLPSPPPGRIEPIPQGLSEGSQQNLEQAGLSSMNLLGKSANKLMQLMEESVRPLDLEKNQEGIQRIEPVRVDQAISCANAIATMVQTQVNVLKAMTPFIKKG